MTKKAYLSIFVLSFALSIFIWIALRLVHTNFQMPQPQAILTLGGGNDRETFTVNFTQSHSSLPIWVSSGQSQKQARQIFQAAGISHQKVRLDYRATDTVSNFTSLIKDFKQENYQHIYLITSDFHMPRAKAIAFFVLGSHGIAYTPVTISSDKAIESKLKIIRDVGRSRLITGKTGSRFNNKYARMMLKQE